MAVQNMAPGRRTLWRFFPLAVFLLMTLVVAVNFGMVWSALRTFPGTVIQNAFDTSNVYNEVLENARQQAALGWRLDVAAGQGRLVVTLLDAAGKPLPDAVITAHLTHPVGPADLAELSLAPQEAGRYTAPLPGAGQWQVELTIRAGGQELLATRKVVGK